MGRLIRGYVIYGSYVCRVTIIYSLNLKDRYIQMLIAQYGLHYCKTEMLLA